MTAQAAAMLREAADLVSGDRNALYGDAYEQHLRAAFIFNGWLKAKYGGLPDLDAADMCEALIAVKKSRPLQTGVPHRDTDVDCVAYQALRAYCDERKRLG